MSEGRSTGVAHKAAELLSFAASPVFAVMALITFAHGARTTDMICSTAGHALPLSGMTAMYLLMSAFHCAPWLRLASRARGCTGDWER